MSVCARVNPMTSSSCCSLSCKRSRQACTMECPTTVGTSPWRRNLSCCTGWSNGDIFATAFWKRPHEKNSDCPQIRKFRILKSVSFHRIHRYPSNFHRYPSRFQQSLIWLACLFEICDREFQRGDSGNLDNLPWNHPHMTSKNCTLRLLASRFSNYI